MCISQNRFVNSMSQTPCVAMLIGLQGSGKSSFYRVCFSSTHEHLSKDNWPNAKNREARLQRELRAALEQGRSVVIDNTNVTRAQRAGVLAIARELGVPVRGYVFPLDLAGCLARNASRQGRARVPERAILATINLWEAPSLDEGFAALLSVQLRDGDFEIGDYNYESK
jgi:predicted kinase